MGRRRASCTRTHACARIQIAGFNSCTPVNNTDGAQTNQSGNKSVGSVYLKARIIAMQKAGEFIPACTVAN